MKLELEGFLYLVTNEYDMYEVDEIYFDEDMNNIEFENLDRNSYKHFEWRNHGGYCGKAPKVNIKEPTLLVDILKEKLQLQSCTVENNKGKFETYTFKPKTKKVKITIEEIE